VYIPDHFHQADPAKLYGLIEGNPFALLVSHGDDGPYASHLPVFLDRQSEGKTYLYGHMARANPHWRLIRGQVLVVFSGAHAYISPTWYEAQEVVPTWNYVAVHVYGDFQMIEDQDELLSILRRSVALLEQGRPQSWSVEAAEEYVRKLAKGVVGFRIPIARMEGKWKLSQNHPRERREKVVRALRSQADEQARTVAALMEEVLAAESGGKG
jgi:transcriptional regulator